MNAASGSLLGFVCCPRLQQYFRDALHKYVSDTGLELLLVHWRTDLQLPIGARQSLFTTYTLAWAHMSAFCIWTEAWTLLSGPERVQLYKTFSLPYPDFAADDMLDVVYAASCCRSLETMD